LIRRLGFDEFRSNSREFPVLVILFPVNAKQFPVIVSNILHKQLKYNENSPWPPKNSRIFPGSTGIWSACRFRGNFCYRLKRDSLAPDEVIE
jgi:hypothetical protein